MLFLLEFPYSFVYIIIISWHVFITCRYIPRVETSYLGNVHFPSVGSPSCYPQLSTALTVTGTGRRWDHLVLVHYSCLSIQSPVIIRWVWTITFYNYEISWSTYTHHSSWYRCLRLYDLLHASVSSTRPLLMFGQYIVMCLLVLARRCTNKAQL